MERTITTQLVALGKRLDRVEQGAARVEHQLCRTEKAAETLLSEVKRRIARKHWRR